MTLPVESCKVRTGSGNGLVRYEMLSEGPKTRNATFLDSVPDTMKPPISASSPGPIFPRVEILSDLAVTIGNLVFSKWIGSEL